MKGIFKYIIFILLFVPVKSMAQNHNGVGFSKLFQYTGDSLPKGSLIGFIAYDSNNNRLYFALDCLEYNPATNVWKSLMILYKTDINGNVIKTKIDSAIDTIPYKKRYGAMLLSADGKSIFWTGNKIKSMVDTATSTMILTKTDTNLNLIWQKEYPTPFKNAYVYNVKENLKTGNLSVLAVKTTPSGSALPDTPNHIRYIKMDSMGNILSETALNLAGFANAPGRVKTNDGGYILSGTLWHWHGSNPQPPPNYSGNAYAMKVDENNHPIWHHFYAPHAYMIRFAGNLSLNNGFYINIGSVIPEKHLLGHGTIYGESYGYVNKIDSRGQLIWENQFSYPAHEYVNSVFGVTKASQQDIVICGSFAVKDTTNGRGWLVRFDKDGHILWNRQITRFPQIHNRRYLYYPEEYLYRVINLKDGSFIAVGSSFGKDRHGQPTQQAGWMVRVDSNGCITPCPTADTTGIVQAVLTKQNIKVFPNPTAGGVTIKRKKPFPAGTVLWLMDNNGRTIKTLKSPTGKATVHYDLKKLSAGVYYLVFKIKNSTFKVKLVLIR